MSSSVPYNISLFDTSRNQQEVHIYDVACPETPCLRLGDSSRHTSRSEGVLKATFLPSSSAAKSCSTHILTGGNYGTVRLWTIVSKPQSSRQQQKSSNLSAKCQWSIPVFGSKGGEGVCDMMVLPSTTPSLNNDQMIQPSSMKKYSNTTLPIATWR